MKVAILQKICMYGVQCKPHQNSIDVLYTDRKIHPKVHMETQKTSNSHSNTEQKEQCFRYHNTNFNLHYSCRDTAIKRAWYWHRERQEDKGNTIEDPDINPHSYSHFIFDKGAQST
jgi:hypothetical protein